MKFKTNFTSASYTLSPDNNYVLIRYNPISLLPSSYREYYPIGDNEHLHYASWSPSGHSLVYIFHNNIYYVSEPTAAAIQVTTDGVPDVIYNGIPDWVYEEEVLSSGSAVWFSPDGTKLAFAYFDDTEVPEFTYFMYENEDDPQYPRVVKLRYPKVGARNPDFKVRVVTLSDPTNVNTLPVLTEGQESKDYVLFRVTWPTNDEVVAVIENRVQNQAVVRRCQLDDLTCATESSFTEPNGWLEMEAPIYSKDGTQSLVLRSQPEGDDSFTHIILCTGNCNQYKQLTSGRRVVLSINGWDQERNLVLYTGTAIDSPFTQHVFYYNLDTDEDTCITCTYQTPEGPCLFAGATFSTDYSYAGPDSTQISERFSTGFQNYIVTNRQYIYVYIDGRGSGKKGDNIRFQIYRKMATVEIEDQIAVMKYLRDSLPFIDPDRIGIWGWSYGGFATAWVLAQDTEHVFRFGLSVAPVTDFALYDTIYTERYMGLITPEDNQAGYNNTDINRRVELLRNKSFFLIHGNADDNVHYQQSMLLAKALEHADILFYQMSYPDENHALSSVYPHLYHSIDRYFC
ncbi:protease family s9bc dipeptidyl-peptidase iv-related [Holotrichia oblita]|uniref:Protease family s9bc dipeptidyl-peptidase iv-related n=1 Tax=Holotrichia oblita TaxID=644536 RepID=A0ACB9TD10_HOLOL|nr:protease family s9bc dipeptidyl-peptidase iv-related [Holotrichia oblita]